MKDVVQVSVPPFSLASLIDRILERQCTGKYEYLDRYYDRPLGTLPYLELPKVGTCKVYE